MYALFFLLLISWFLSLFVYTPLTNAPLWEREGKVNLKEKKQTNKQKRIPFFQALTVEGAINVYQCQRQLFFIPAARRQNK